MDFIKSLRHVNLRRPANLKHVPYVGQAPSSRVRRLWVKVARRG